MKYRNTVQFLWIGLGVFVVTHMVINIVEYFGPDMFYRATWKMKQILSNAVAAVAILFNVFYVGRGGLYIRVSVVLISLFFGLYGILWLLLGGEGHILWRIGFPGFLILTCVCTLIVQKRNAK